MYELQRRASLNTEYMLKTNDDIRSIIESSSNQNNPIENERDKLLIQPIVRKI